MSRCNGMYESSDKDDHDALVSSRLHWQQLKNNHITQQTQLLNAFRARRQQLADLQGTSRRDAIRLQHSSARPGLHAPSSTNAGCGGQCSSAAVPALGAADNLTTWVRLDLEQACAGQLKAFLIQAGTSMDDINKATGLNEVQALAKSKVNAWEVRRLAAASMLPQTSCYTIFEGMKDIAALQKARQELALRVHPDKNPDDGELAKVAFQFLNEAFESARLQLAS